MTADASGPPGVDRVLVEVSDADGRTVTSFPLTHGGLLLDELDARGVAATGVLGVSRRLDRPELTIRLVGEAVARSELAPGQPEPAVVPVDPGLRVAEGESPRRRQRIAAYAVVHSSRGLLLVQYTAATRFSGLWGLPGGGVDPGESPEEALHRELWEETGQRIEIQSVVDVQTDRWIGRAPDGVVEDYHVVRVIYVARCPDPSDPVVHEVDGTTGASTWVVPGATEGYPVTTLWDELLSGLVEGWSTGR